MDVNGRNEDYKMTLLLWFALGAFFNDKVSDLALPSAHAGWEYNETARPRKKKGTFPKSAAPVEAGPVADEPPNRVQVFGKPTKDISADEYARMLKEDQATTEAPTARSEPAAEPAALEAAVPAETITTTTTTTTNDPAVDTDFEALRARLRTKRVAENDPVNEKDYEPAAQTKKTTPPAKRARIAPKPSPAYIPPPPPMETEVITPQKATGKKVKGLKTAPAIEPSAPRGDDVNAAFSFTHMLPSPFNIPRGSYVLGSSLAYGVFDSFEVSTDLVRTINQQWNFRAKVPLIEYPTFIASAFVDYTTFNAHHFDESNPDEWTKRWQPGLVTGYEITPDIAFFLGGNFSFGKKTLPIETTTAYLHGASANMEWSWLYNPSTSRLGNNAISLGISYDFTYSLFGLGFTHHWKAFDLGVHYVFADRAKFLPIFSFSASF